MTQRWIILALCGLVLLLLGVIVGQTVERTRAHGARMGPALASEAAPGPAASANTIEPPRVPLAETEYWVSTPKLDATKIGFAAWAVLRPGGNLIVERCRAPDYAVPREPSVPLMAPVVRCESMVDGMIVGLDDDQLVVRPGNGAPRTFRYSLAGKGSAERLVLDAAKGVELVPGSKNTLVDRLLRLPSDEEARNRYMRRMFTAFSSPSRGAPPVPGRNVP